MSFSTLPSYGFPDFASVLGSPPASIHMMTLPLQNMRSSNGSITVPRLIPTRYRQYLPVPRGLVDFFNSNIHLVQVATLIHTHLCNDEAAATEARSHKREHIAHVFLRLTPPGTSAIGSRLPDIPTAIPTPETLPPTALAPPSILPVSRPSSLPAPPPSLPSQASSGRPQHIPPFFLSSESKRPRLPGKGTSSGSHTGYMSQFADTNRPIGFAPIVAERSARGPYQTSFDKGKGADKGKCKGKDFSSSDWPSLGQGPPKGFSKGTQKGPHKGADTIPCLLALLSPPLPLHPFSAASLGILSGS